MTTDDAIRPAKVDPSSLPDLPGTPYRVLAKLAVGGVGEVFEGEHVGLRKRVVVKLLHHRFQTERATLDRMRIEAQSLALLSHPNIVQVSDFGTTNDGRTYLVTERLYGRTLDEEFKARGALPAIEAIAIARQILAGLGAAHEAGIIHRDIKLGNIFLCDAPEGPRYVKLLDFGIAKVLRERADDRGPEPLAFPTGAGLVVGSPPFFSPEQAQALSADARSDIYATGVVLYKLLAGKHPFEDAHSVSNMLWAHIHALPDPPSLAAATPGREPLPQRLDTAVLKALEKSPGDRFQSAYAFSIELGAIASELAGGAAAFQGRWESTVPIEPMRRPAAPATPTVNPSAERRRADLGPRDTVPLPPELRQMAFSSGSLRASSVLMASTEPIPPGAHLAGASAEPAQSAEPIPSAAPVDEDEPPPALEVPDARTRLAFGLSVVVSAIAFGAATAVILLQLLR